MAIRTQLLIAGIIIATHACGWAQDAEKGRIEFLSYCAECHGADGKGAGPLGSDLKIKPPDLTVLARKSSGVFAADAIAKEIDRRSVPHRFSEMPIWGCRQAPLPNPKKKGHKRRPKLKPRPIDTLLDMPCDPEEVIQKRIRDVVEFLDQIQEK